MKQFYLKIADIYSQLTIEKSLLDYFKKEYWLLEKANESVFRVDIIKDKTKNLKEIDFEAMAKISVACIAKNILFLHASAVVKNRKGYVFMGNTGAGKSTIIKNIKKGIYAEDTAVIKKEKEKFYLYRSPFDKRRVGSVFAKPVPVDKIFVLRQAKRNNISAMDVKEKFLSIIRNDTYIYKRNLLPKNFYSLVFDLIKSTTIEKLYFRKDFNPNLELP